MPQLTLPFNIEPMTVADIPAVVAIEHLSYSMTWPDRAYDYELQKNNLAHYFVLKTSLVQPPAPQQLIGNKPIESPAIIGLGGFWLMADEVHISTIAVHPDWRGLGLGEWLLFHLLEAGQDLGAEVATLEVRPSNQPALSLYYKYGFEEVGCRPRYYTDNNEDALILTTPNLTLPDYQAILDQRRKALRQRLANLYDKTG
jgi:[ribosomal protein S18]-alanine N-acetyltransferase